jgi:polyhydroxyalkanoate synthesis regulator phasin
VRDALKSYLALAGGVTEVTRQRALDAAKALVASGEAAAEQVTSLAEDLLTQTRQNREAVVALVGFEVDRALGRVGLASADEVAELTQRVRALEAQLQGGGGIAGSTPAAEARPVPVRRRAVERVTAAGSAAAKGGATGTTDAAAAKGRTGGGAGRGAAKGGSAASSKGGSARGASSDKPPAKQARSNKPGA